MESATTSTFLDVWATRSGDPLAGFVVNAVPGEIFSLGENGWSRETLAQPWSLNGVWGRSAQDVFAVGEIETERPPDAEFAFRAVVLRRQAGAWLEMPGLTPPAGSEGTPWSLNDAWGFGNDLFAVGTFYSSREGEIVGGFVAQHNGTTWTTTRLLPNEGVGLESVSGISASDVYAVGGAFGAGSDLQWNDLGRGSAEGKVVTLGSVGSFIQFCVRRGSRLFQLLSGLGSYWICALL
jgi:hypothetical protein